MSVAWLEILRPEQALVARLTAEGQSVAEISLGSAGWERSLQSVSEDTVRHWHRSPAFQAALAHFKAERDEVLRSLTVQGAQRALEGLIADLESATYKVRIGAAKLLLQHHRAYLASVVELRTLPTEGVGLVPKEALSSAEALLARLGNSEEAP